MGEKWVLMRVRLLLVWDQTTETETKYLLSPQSHLNIFFSPVPQCRSSSNWNWLHAKNTCVCTVHWLESEAPVIGFNSVIHSPYKYADWNIQHCHPLQFHFITISVSNNPWLVVQSCECQLRYFHHSQCFPTYSLCPNTANVHIAKKSKNPLNVFLPPAWHDSGKIDSYTNKCRVGVTILW